MRPHTPGPWYVQDLHPGHSTYSINTTPNRRLQGEVAVIFRGGGTGNYEADARLIAAAPELLHCLKEVRGKLGCAGTGPNKDHYYCEFCGVESEGFSLMEHKSGCLVLAVDTAIAKAEGRS